MNILLVDDEPNYRLLAGSLMKNEGWTVITAENGQEALKKLSQTAVDIIVSDVYMPVMDGFKFHNAVRDDPAFRDIPFLFVSGYDDEFTRAAVKTPKLDGFVKKTQPFSDMKAWIEFLTTPESKRVGFSPFDRSKTGPAQFDRRTPERKRR
jgi:CheY-like chemotaxis protein